MTELPGGHGEASERPVDSQPIDPQTAALSEEITTLVNLLDQLRERTSTLVELLGGIPPDKPSPE